MGVTHHSNYIKWMEEARIWYLEQLGWGYDKLEADGVLSPVTGVEARYLHATTFGDAVSIRVRVEEFKGVRLVIGYEMADTATGETVFTGRSMHCFTGREGRPVILRRQFPELDRMLRTLAEQTE
jgi:acyl-CoA thioester hydrolase